MQHGDFTLWGVKGLRIHDVGADLLLQFGGLTCGGGALPDGICGADVIGGRAERAGEHARLDFRALFFGE